jgi:hypothetical protein
MILEVGLKMLALRSCFCSHHEPNDTDSHSSSNSRL